MLRKLAFMVAISPVFWLTAAHALGLGEIDVKSRLNQRFSAVIPLTAVSGDEAEGLLVRLADNDDFAKAGLDRVDYLSALNFEVRMDGGNPRIVVSSKQIAREPFLSFLLDVRGKNGRVLREYTVLLDPPSYADSGAAPVPAAPAKSASDFYQTAEEAAQPARAPGNPTPPPAAPPVEMVAVPPPAPTPAPAAAPTTAAAGEGQATYGPVQPQETFWSIATKLRPGPSVTMDQMLWAIYSNNSGAFEGGRIGGLRKGSVLKVPSASQIAAVSPQVAKIRVAQLRGGHAVGGGKPHKARTPKPAVQTEPKPEVSAAPKMPEPAPTPPPSPKPEPQAKPAPAAPAAAAPAEKKTPENAAQAAVKPPPKPAAPAPLPAAPPPSQANPPPATAPETPVQTAPAATAVSPSESSAAQVPAQTPAPAAVPTEQAATPAAPPPAPVPVPPVASTASGWSMDDLMLPVGGGIAVLLLGLLGLRGMKQRKSKPEAAAGKPSFNLQFWKKKAADEVKPPPAGSPAGLGRSPKFAVPPPPPAATGKKTPPVDPLAQTVIDKKKDPTLTQTLSNTLANTELAQTVKREPAPAEPAQLPNFDSTQIFGTSSDKLANSINTDTVDFDIAGKFEAETLKIDLDANDPVSEADFHLAYGLYDEAALLLESAAEKNPGRTDIRVKLAETYFRASKPHEFEEVAQSLKSQLDPAEWQKLAIMGSQLLPDSPLFQGAAQEAALEHSVDLSFDEPEVAAAPAAAGPAPAPPAADKPKMSSTGAFSASGAYSSSASSALDFKLEDLEPAAGKQESKPEAKPEARTPTGNTLEFNLTEFDLSKPGAPEAVAPAADHASETLAFDLSGDFKSPAVAAKAAITPAEDIKLDDFDLGELPQDSHAISSGDEAGTKLDLARAYADMGDNEMARSLLNEVLQQGSGDQKKEAQALIQRLA